MSQRQLSQLKSSLPSPNKYKGKTRNEAMGIKAGAWGITDADASTSFCADLWWYAVSLECG